MPHIDRVLNGCNQCLFSRPKIRKCIPSQVAVLVFKALVMSKLNYGNLLCMGVLKATVECVQKFQNRALQVCYCARCYTSNFKLHLESGVLPVHLRRKLDLYKIMYKPMLSNPENHPEQDHPLTRYGSAWPPTFDRPRSVRFLESVTYQGPKLWAELLNHVKKSK